jgi:uncharacterized phage protein (TIGR01671 family)
MRDIRFRGKRSDNGEWIYGYIQFSKDKSSAWICESKEDDWTVKNQFPNHPETVGQYTGLKDKNGKEIYEGDILHHVWNSGHDHMLETTSFVKWYNAAFFVDDLKRSDWMLSMHTLADWATVEIIGNIHEHPHLLDGEEQKHEQG